MELIEIKQDLFKMSKEYSLVHCISLDCKLGAGIAKEFRRRYPKMPGYLIGYIKGNHVNYPTTIGYKADLENRYIFNLITKNKYWNKPTYKTLEISLKKLKDLCEEYKINKIAMPLIGCGLDKLAWNNVREIIEDVFKDTNIKIVVCKL